MFKRIRSFFKSESDKLKGLTMKQKLGYVCDYYCGIPINNFIYYFIF